MASYIEEKSNKYPGSGIMQKESAPGSGNISGCYSCERVRCTCGNNEDYIKKLVACITKEVMDKIGN